MAQASLNSPNKPGTGFWKNLRQSYENLIKFAVFWTGHGTGAPLRRNEGAPFEKNVFLIV